MSGSLTVVGGVNNSTITGLVTVPAVFSNFNPNIISNLQAFLSGTVQGAVTQGSAVANFENFNVAGLSGNENASVANGSVTQGLLDISNTDTTGATVAGSTNISLLVPVGYNFVVAQAPGTETITGNGSTNFLGVFGSAAGVTFNSNGGSGTVAAGGIDDFVNVSGTTWSVVGNAAGGATINSTASTGNLQVSGTGAATGGPLSNSVHSNVVGLAGATENVTSSGSNDLIASYGGSDSVSVAGGADVVVDGGSVTVNAAAGSTVNAFFGSSVAGGTIYFVNNSGTAASVTGSSNTALAAGSVTVFAGAGGGYYQGGAGGGNLLQGGSVAGAGNVTLIGGGIGNSINAFYGNNDLKAAAGGTSTIIAGAGTDSNDLAGGGNDSLLSFGSGAQAFFFGTGNTETATGSTVAGATNNYFVLEQSSQGGATDIITNFSTTNSTVYINPQGYGGGTGVSIAAFSAYVGPGGGTNVELNDGTTIRLIGVSLTNTQEAAITASGGTQF
jgi:hypothetical protein